MTLTNIAAEALLEASRPPLETQIGTAAPTPSASHHQPS